MKWAFGLALLLGLSPLQAELQVTANQEVSEWPNAGPNVLVTAATVGKGSISPEQVGNGQVVSQTFTIPSGTLNLDEYRLQEVTLVYRTTKASFMPNGAVLFRLQKVPEETVREYPEGDNLLKGETSYSIQYDDATGGAPKLMTINFSGAEQPVLAPGKFAFEIIGRSLDDAQNLFIWRRNSDPYFGGNAFRDREVIEPGRDFEIAFEFNGKAGGE